MLVLQVMVFTRCCAAAVVLVVMLNHSVKQPMHALCLWMR